MHPLKQHSLLVTDATLEKWHGPVHRPEHFTILFISEGNGKVKLNNEAIKYEHNDLFILGPDDQYYLDIINTTRYISVSFTDEYFTVHARSSAYWLKEIEAVLNYKAVTTAKIICTDTDKALLTKLYGVISTLHRQHGNATILFFQLASVLSVIKKNLPVSRAVQSNHQLTEPATKLKELTFHIRENIHRPKLLRTKYLAKLISMPERYVGPFFKRNAGITLRAYIDQHKQAKIESRMLDPDYTLKQIAADFGLMDESHFNKVFKKFKGISPRAYRKQLGGK